MRSLYEVSLLNKLGIETYNLSLPVSQICTNMLAVFFSIELPNVCDTSPCENGATCNNLGNQYECVCAPGYAGTYCEQGQIGYLFCYLSPERPMMHTQHFKKRPMSISGMTWTNNLISELLICTMDEYRTIDMPIWFMCACVKFHHPSVFPILQHTKDPDNHRGEDAIFDVLPS